MLWLPFPGAWHRHGLWWPHCGGPAVGETFPHFKAATGEKEDRHSLDKIFPIQPLQRLSLPVSQRGGKYWASGLDCRHHYPHLPPIRPGSSCSAGELKDHAASLWMHVLIQWKRVEPLSCAAVTHQTTAQSHLMTENSKPGKSLRTTNWSPTKKAVIWDWNVGKLSVWGSSKCCHMDVIFFFSFGPLKISWDMISCVRDSTQTHMCLSWPLYTENWYAQDNVEFRFFVSFCQTSYLRSKCCATHFQ